MEMDQLQFRIDNGKTAEDYLTIARQYLAGSPVRDPVAAQAWLNKAIEADDPVISPAAMGLLAREVLGKKQVIPEEEIAELKLRAKRAAGREKQELEALLELV